MTDYEVHALLQSGPIYKQIQVWIKLQCVDTSHASTLTAKIAFLIAMALGRQSISGWKG